MKKILLIILFLLALINRLYAARATIGGNTGNTYSGVADTQIAQSYPTTNFSTDTTLEASKYASGDHRNTLIKFTGLSSITGPVNVIAATLYLNANASYGTNNLAAYRLLRNWVTNQASWNE